MKIFNTDAIPKGKYVYVKYLNYSAKTVHYYFLHYLINYVNGTLDLYYIIPQHQSEDYYNHSMWIHFST